MDLYTVVLLKRYGHEVGMDSHLLEFRISPVLLRITLFNVSMFAVAFHQTSSGRGRGGGRRAGGRGRGPKGAERPAKTAADLDAEMEVGTRFNTLANHPMNLRMSPRTTRRPATKQRRPQWLEYFSFFLPCYHRPLFLLPLLSSHFLSARP